MLKAPCLMKVGDFRNPATKDTNPEGKNPGEQVKLAPCSPTSGRHKVAGVLFCVASVQVVSKEDAEVGQLLECLSKEVLLLPVQLEQEVRGLQEGGLQEGRRKGEGCEIIRQDWIMWKAV